MAYDFDKIARSYDRLNWVMTLGLDARWRSRAARAATEGGAGAEALDVACGTGDMAISLLRRGAQVTGVDLSRQMLAIARQKVDAWMQTGGVQTGSFGCRLMEADAEQLPFDDESFDVVTSAFGVRNFVHLDAGLAEMVRVLRRGGRLVVLEMATPDSRWVLPFYHFYVKVVIPWLGKVLAGNKGAYVYLPTSIEHFPKGETFMGKLRALGCDVRQRRFTFGVCRQYVAVKR